MRFGKVFGVALVQRKSRELRLDNQNGMETYQNHANIQIKQKTPCRSGIFQMSLCLTIKLLHVMLQQLIADKRL